MNQSSFIAGALLAGFVLYLAAKGRLSAYTAVLWGPTNVPVSGGSGDGSGGSSDTASTIIKEVPQALEFAAMFGA